MSAEKSVGQTLRISNGKNVYVYRFGGEGNDWCFVRTPENYVHNRKTPYPFVICNHGNGWKMDGTLHYANWTKRTMYLPADAEEFSSGSTDCIAVDDPALWYSNPTIEALLNAGYIVCGCQNYADGLFGNEACRQACVAFYRHMVQNYNVQDNCYMIGASNGAQTSINAAFLLKEKVKAMILQFPLTCLIQHYFSCPSHQPRIRSAFGIANADISPEELVQVLGPYDALHANVQNGRLQGYFPPSLLYYSTTDSLVNYKENALSLAELLKNSGVEVSAVQVDCEGCEKEHGDPAHFVPNEFVSWFERF